MRHVLAALVLALLGGAALGQTTINVPSDQATMREAIVAAISGDTVNLEAGTVDTTTVTATHTSSKDNITLTADDSTAVWIGNGIGSIISLQNGNDNWTISGLHFRSNGTDNRKAIRPAGADGLTVQSCYFEKLGAALYNNQGLECTGMVFDQNTYINHLGTGGQSNRGEWFFNTPGVQISNNVADLTNFSSPTLLSFFYIRGSDDADVLANTLTLNSGDSVILIHVVQASEDVNVERNIISEGGSGQAIFFGSGASSDLFSGSVVQMNDVTITGSAGRGIEFEAGHASAAQSNSLKIVGNKVTGPAGGTGAGILATENTAYVLIAGNKVTGFNNGVTIQSSQYPVLDGNTFKGCTIGIAYSANGVIAGEETLAAQQVRNLFWNCTSATMLDMYDTSTPGIARQDSLSMSGPNFYVGVTNYGRWVDETDSDTPYTTLSGWQAHLASMSGIIEPDDDSVDLGSYSYISLLRGFNLITPRRALGGPAGLGGN